MKKKKITAEELKALIEKRFIITGPKALSQYALNKEIEGKKLAQLSLYSSKLKTAQDIPNERGPLT